MGLVLASPVLLVAAPCIICCKCRSCTKSDLKSPSSEPTSSSKASSKGFQIALSFPRSRMRRIKRKQHFTLPHFIHQSFEESQSYHHLHNLYLVRMETFDAKVSEVLE